MSDETMEATRCSYGSQMRNSCDGFEYKCDHCGVEVEPLRPEKHPKPDCPRARAEAVWLIDNDTED